MKNLLKKNFFPFHPTRIKFIRLLFLNIVTLLRPRTVHCKHNISLFIPKSDRSFYTYYLWRYGEYETIETQEMLSVIQKGDVVVDVGANIGYYTCLYGQAVGLKGTVYAFEPEPGNYTILKKNLELNNRKNVKMYQVALAHTKGTRPLYLCDDNKGDHTLVPMGDRKTREIEISSFDDFFRDQQINIKLVKIDVQGFEFEVLKGMEESFKRGFVENVFVEFTPQRVKAAGHNPKEFIDYVLSFSDMKNRIVSSTYSDKFVSLETVNSELDQIAESEFNSFNVHIKKINRNLKEVWK